MAFASCTLAVISEKGRRLKDFPVETKGQALVEAVRMIPGYKRFVFKEGLQSAWLYETLSPHVDELVMTGITQSRGLKSDKRDAYGLAEKLRAAPSSQGCGDQCAPTPYVGVRASKKRSHNDLSRDRGDGNPSSLRPSPRIHWD